MYVQRLRQSIFAILTILLTAIPVVASDISPFDHQHGLIKIAGGTAHIPVMKEVAKRIMRHNADIQITIAGGGSGVGIQQVGEGMVQIGNSGRAASEQEISRFGLVPFRWAIDGVGAVVNPENPVQSLTRDQLQAIYAGTINNWQQLGGSDRNINLYTRDQASGTRKVFWKKALAKQPISTSANVVNSNGAMKTAIASDPYAIGYVSVGHIDTSVSAIILDGVKPTLATVQSGQYSVARGLYSITKGQPDPLTQAFIDYLLSASGQKIAADKGFIPVR